MSKQFGSSSGLTKCRTWSGSKLFVKTTKNATCKLRVQIKPNFSHEWQKNLKISTELKFVWVFFFSSLFWVRSDFKWKFYVWPTIYTYIIHYFGQPFFCHVSQMSRNMRFPTMWYVWPAKAQTSLCISAVWSEPLLVACIFYECWATDQTLEFLSLKGGCTGSSLSLHLSKCHIVGNHMSQLKCHLLAHLLIDFDTCRKYSTRSDCLMLT